MKTQVERETPTRLKLSIEAEPSEYKDSYEETLRRLSREVRVPGFRRGKVPKPVLESRIGIDTIKQEALKEALPRLFRRAADDESIRPISLPDMTVDHFELGENLTFTAVIEVRPEVPLPSYVGIEAERPSTEVPEEEITRHFDRLRDRYGSLEEVTRTIREGDFALLDMICYQHSNKIDEMSINDLLYPVGSKSIVGEDLDNELMGKRTGDILKLNATLDEALGEPWGGEEVTFSIIVKQVQAKRLPPLDDDFAKQASEFDTLEELRADIVAKLEAVKTFEAETAARNAVIDQLLDMTEVDIPEGMLDYEIKSRIKRIRTQLERSKVSLEDYLKANRMTEAQLVEEARKSAERAIASDFILEAIAEKEGFEATEEDVEREVEMIARRLRKTPDEAWDELVATDRVEQLTGDILRRKALDYVVENAKLTEAPPQGSIELRP
ncbi:MAG: trigger factor [Actinomycetota bacterium]